MPKRLTMRECHHFDLEDVCYNRVCPQRIKCRKVRRKLGSRYVESEQGGARA